MLADMWSDVWAVVVAEWRLTTDFWWVYVVIVIIVAAVAAIEIGHSHFD